MVPVSMPATSSHYNPSGKNVLLVTKHCRCPRGAILELCLVCVGACDTSLGGLWPLDPVGEPHQYKLVFSFRAHGDLELKASAWNLLLLLRPKPDLSQSPELVSWPA
jgi:hypothetical protein